MTLNRLRDGGIAHTPGGPPAAAPSATTGQPRPGRSGPLLILRGALVLAAVGLAYHYSLLTLLRNLALDTPLAYLGLVPFIALLLAVVTVHRSRGEPDVHDRYVDYIVGAPLLILALLVMVVVPIALSSFFWRWRLDLLTLPLFVCGAVTLVFGLRTAVRMKVAIAFLLLAWPLPYTLLLGDVLDAYTNTTVRSLQGLVTLIPVAQAAGGGDGSLFFVPHGGDGFVVSIGSACSGVNGALGFLLVGGAIAGIARGAALGKALWLANGLILTMALNLARIMVILAAGNRWGSAVAIDALHPFIGLVTFNVGVAACLLGLPLFGLSLRGAPSRASAAAPLGAARAGALAPRRLPVQRAATALCLVVAASALAGTADAGLREFQAVADDLGPPRLGEWSAALAPVDGWTVRLTNSYPWVEQYFGRGATWNRYSYLSSMPALGRASPPAFVNLDVISTWDLGTFSTYGLEACYGFHNYQVLDTGTVDLGAGVIGHTVSYVEPAIGAAWTALYWEWPVKSGARERYERIILNVPSELGGILPASASTGAFFPSLQLAVASLLGGGSADPPDAELASVHDFLVGFARQLVLARTATA